MTIVRFNGDEENKREKAEIDIDKRKLIMSSSSETVREQFSALQKQQKERLSQLQEKSAKKKTSIVDTNTSLNLEVDSGPFPIEEVRSLNFKQKQTNNCLE